MEILILANTLAFFDGTLYSLSTLVKDYRCLIFLHICSAVCALLCNYILGASTGVILGFVGLFYIVYRYLVPEPKNNYIFYVIIVLQSILVVLFNNVGLIGILPLIASISYTIVSFHTNSSRTMTTMMIVNAILWIPYTIYFSLYISSLFMAITIVFGMIRLKKTPE